MKPWDFHFPDDEYHPHYPVQNVPVHERYACAVEYPDGATHIWQTIDHAAVKKAAEAKKAAAPA